MAKFKIEAIAPTSYQYGSLRNFGLEIKSYLNGKHVAEGIFDTEKEAKAYLVERAEMYFDGNSDGDEERLAEALESIEKYGSVYLDAVCGSIEEVEEVEEV